MALTYCILEKNENIKVSELGFSWSAFLFSPVWALVHNLWKEFTVWLLFVSFCYFMGMKFGVEFFYVALLLYNFIWGFFGRDLKIQDFINNGYIPLEIINSTSGQIALLTYLSKRK